MFDNSSQANANILFSVEITKNQQKEDTALLYPCKPLLFVVDPENVDLRNQRLAQGLISEMSQCRADN